MIVNRFAILLSLFFLSGCFLLPQQIQIVISPGGELEEGFEARGRIQAVASFVDATEAKAFNFGSILAADIAQVEPQNLYYRKDIDDCISLIYLYGPLLNEVLNYQQLKNSETSNIRSSVTGGLLSGTLCSVQPYTERSEESYQQ